MLAALSGNALAAGEIAGVDDAERES